MPRGKQMSRKEGRAMNLKPSLEATEARRTSVSQKPVDIQAVDDLPPAASRGNRAAKLLDLAPEHTIDDAPVDAPTICAFRLTLKPDLVPHYR
jgi:hypothetical protein